MSRSVTRVILVLGAAAVLAYAARQRAGDSETAAPEGTRGTRAAGETAILRAYEDELSDLWVEAGGLVHRVLPDDTKGSRHQRFILRLPSGHTVLVSHNIDLAPRIPDLEAGDEVSFRGEYEWNDRGGVIHWTHHDPDGRKQGGWLEQDGRRYE